MKIGTLFGYPVETPLSLRERAQYEHGKLFTVSTPGPKRWLVLSVYREFNGTTYVIRRSVRGAEILKVFVRS